MSLLTTLVPSPPFSPPPPPPPPPSTGWNMDYEAYNSSMIAAGSGIDFTDPQYIIPFYKALNERIAVVPSGYSNHLEAPTFLDQFKDTPYMHITGRYAHHISESIPSGYYSLLERNDFIETSDDVPVGLYTDMIVSSQRSYYTSNFPRPYTPNFGAGLGYASGLSWGQLQALTVSLARYFIVNRINGAEKNYDNTPGYYKFIEPDGSFGGGYCSYDNYVGNVKYPNVVPNSGTWNPSGISCFVPSLTVDYPYELLHGGPLSLTPIEYDEPQIHSAWPSGSIPFGDPGYASPVTLSEPIRHIYSRKLEDNFPAPSGFRRYFPREIWSLSNGGVNGQIARFTARTAAYGAGYVTASNIWGGHSRESGYRINPATPLDERTLSGQLFRYDGSTWAPYTSGNRPDVVLDYGLAQPGDYMGPWVLNDLRDAINQLVWTYGIELPESRSATWSGVSGRKFPLKLNALPSFNIRRTGINLSGVLEQTSVYTSSLEGESEVSTDPCWGAANGVDEGTDVIIDGLANIQCRVANLSRYGNYSSGSIICPQKYTTYYRDFYNAASLGDYYEAGASYAYIKPSGINFLSRGKTREYEYYAMGIYAGGFRDGSGTVRKIHFNDYGDEDLEHFPNTRVLDYADLFAGGNHPMSGQEGWYFARKFHESTETDWGETIGVQFGDNTLTLPSATGDYDEDAAGGYRCCSFLVISKWDVPSGFVYTSGTI